MRTLHLEVALTYDDKQMHGGDGEGQVWFYNRVLLHPPDILILHSNDLGEEVGEVRILSIKDVKAPTDSPKCAGAIPLGWRVLEQDEEVRTGDKFFYPPSGRWCEHVNGGTSLCTPRQLKLTYIRCIADSDPLDSKGE